MIYVYDCHGEQANTVDNHLNCPVCGAATYNYVKSITPRQERVHGRLDSIDGVRNYYDEHLEAFVRDIDHKHELMRQRGFRYAESSGHCRGASCWESGPKAGKWVRQRQG